MYKRRRRRHIVMPVLAGLLTLATLGSTAFAAPSFSLPQAAAYFSSILCAPNAALAATRRVLDDAMDEDAVPTAQPIDEDDPEAGFWTVGPTEEEMLPQSEAQSVSSGASSVPDGPIPDGMAPLLEAHYEQGAGAGYVSSGAATVRNSTDLPDSEVAAEMMQTLPFQVELNSAEPQVLIMHTHTTETYELEEKNWCDPAFSARSTDLSVNMAAVGAEMAAQLNAAGVNTLHDTTLHDYPSYNGSYAKSNATVRSYLERYPSIKVVLDVHRDAIQRDDGTRVKPVADIGGMKAAQVMIICGADVDGNLPNFKQNLRFASRWQDKMESMFPGLTRPVLFDYRYYNQDDGHYLIGHAHGTLAANAGEPGKLVRKVFKGFGVLHSAAPDQPRPGIFMPPVILAISSSESLSTAATALLTAAAIRSSSISRSSGSTASGLILMAVTSCLPVMVTVTISPLAVPVYSRASSSSCFARISSCIFWT